MVFQLGATIEAPIAVAIQKMKELPTIYIMDRRQRSEAVILLDKTGHVERTLRVAVIGSVRQNYKSAASGCELRMQSSSGRAYMDQ